MKQTSLITNQITVGMNGLQGYSVLNLNTHESKGAYLTVAFGGVILMMGLVAGIVILRRRNSNHPASQVMYSGAHIVGPHPRLVPQIITLLP